MENHPIPQDVTGFQFKLIGSLTIKQFGYLLAGTIGAVIFYYLPISVLIKIPFIALCGIFGTALAFLPVEGRPLDLMLSHFFKAVITPNQYIYSKVGGKIAIFDFQPHQQAVVPALAHHTAAPIHDPAKEQKLQVYLQSLDAVSQTPLDQKEQAYLSTLFQSAPQPAAAPANPALQQPAPAPGMPQVQPPTPMPTPQEQPAPEQTMQAPLAQSTEQPIAAQPSPTIPTSQQPQQTAPAIQPSAPPAEQLQAAQIQTPTAQASIQQASQPVPQTQPAQPQPQQPVPAPQENVRKIPSAMAKSVGLPHTPDVPNVLLGIVKDPRGNILPNILVEVKDKEGNPVRAFKTNTLGQFASATPLHDGSYTVEFEDPKGTHQFDIIDLTASGTIIEPIEVISHDPREELRRALFN